MQLLTVMKTSLNSQKFVWISFQTIIGTLQQIIYLENVDKNIHSPRAIVKNLINLRSSYVYYFMKSISYKKKILTEKFENTELNIIY